MISFKGRIVQFGFGAVGKSFYEKISKEIKYNENNYYVITANPAEFEPYINLGGIVSCFVACEINRDNFMQVFSKYLGEGDLLIDFADTVGTRDICRWCAEQNIMYINTGEADWPDHWYSIFEENELKREMKKLYRDDAFKNKYPIVLQHGNNPGLVSHFVKLGLEYIVRTQRKTDKELKEMLKLGLYNEAAQKLGVRMIHVNDIDLQKVKDEYRNDKLYSTWCTESFWFEMLSEATANIGTHENITYKEKCNMVDEEKGFLEFSNMAVDVKCHTYYPGGDFLGYLVPHEETITIAKSLEVVQDGAVIYRPSVMFIYMPCEYADEFLRKSKVNDYPIVDLDKPQDCEEGDNIIVRGYQYPKNYQIVYKENILEGTEYVGVLIMGDGFDPVWVGNRVEMPFLDKNKPSYWQTPTITPVAMSALAAVKWMIKNKDKGGIYFPEDIDNHHQIVNDAEKYISKTIYKTISSEELFNALHIDGIGQNVADFVIA